jgi:hypothetical protein
MFVCWQTALNHISLRCITRLFVHIIRFRFCFSVRFWSSLTGFETEQQPTNSSSLDVGMSV